MDSEKYISFSFGYVYLSYSEVQKNKKAANV